MDNLSNQKREDQDDEGFVYDLTLQMKEFVTQYNDTVTGRCPICLEAFCEGDQEEE